MHTVELLEEAVALAVIAGIKIRQEWFGGAAAGACEIKGQRWVFIDLSLSPREQLDQVMEALQGLPEPSGVSPSLPLRALLETRRAA